MSAAAQPQASRTSGLGAVRADLEERARSGPFGVDVEAALEALSVSYGDDFTLGHDGEWFWAHPYGSEQSLTAATPDELVAAMRAWQGAS